MLTSTYKDVPKIQPQHIQSRATSRPGSCGTKLIDSTQNISFRYSANEVRSGLINDRKDEDGMGEPGCCNLVIRVALSYAVVSIVLGEEGHTDFGLHKPRGGSNCTPCSGEWGMPGWAERSKLQSNLG